MRHDVAVRVLLLVACLVLSWACGRPSGRHDQVVTIFAAASLRSALDEVDRQTLQPAGLLTRRVYAGTPDLARQIEAGAPADVFIAADEAWMDRMQQGGHLRESSRVTLLGNALALIAPADADLPIALDRTTDLRARLGDGRLAIADPDTVPAGRYARQALTRLGLWDQVADRLAPHENVRAALAVVAAGEAPLGLVYASDAVDQPRVRVVADVPADTHAPIRYPAALTRTSGPRAAAVLHHLRGSQALGIFIRHGFTPPPA